MYRPYTSSIMITHVFMIYTSYYVFVQSFTSVDIILSFMYLIGTVLSFFYHRSCEIQYCTIEGYIAKITTVLFFIRHLEYGLVHVTMGMIIMIPGIIAWVSGYFSKENYEKYHYLLHIFVCLSTLYGYRYR